MQARIASAAQLRCLHALQVCTKVDRVLTFLFRILQSKPRRYIVAGLLALPQRPNIQHWRNGLLHLLNRCTQQWVFFLTRSYSQANTVGPAIIFMRISTASVVTSRWTLQTQTTSHSWKLTARRRQLAVPDLTPTESKPAFVVLDTQVGVACVYLQAEGRESLHAMELHRVILE